MKGFGWGILFFIFSVNLVRANDCKDLVLVRDSLDIAQKKLVALESPSRDERKELVARLYDRGSQDILIEVEDLARRTANAILALEKRANDWHRRNLEQADRKILRDIMSGHPYHSPAVPESSIDSVELAAFQFELAELSKGLLYFHHIDKGVRYTYSRFFTEGNGIWSLRLSAATLASVVAFLGTSIFTPVFTPLPFLVMASGSAEVAYQTSGLLNRDEVLRKLLRVFGMPMRPLLLTAGALPTFVENRLLVRKIRKRFFKVLSTELDEPIKNRKQLKALLDNLLSRWQALSE